MLQEVLPRAELSGLAGRRRKGYDSKSVKNSEVDGFIAAGWTVKKAGPRTTRLTKEKPLDRSLEDRVWTLLYHLGFSHMSGEGGAILVLDPAKPDGASSQLDVVALDDEVAIVIECKTMESPGKDPRFQEKLAKFAVGRERLHNAVRSQFPVAHKRPLVQVLFTHNILVSENDRQRAEAERVALLDHQDLLYYEGLVAHLGPAARYQFLADLLPHRQIPGLAIRIPAVQAKMGAQQCYSFCIRPEYLLKIAYVSHRAKGRASDLDAYQRMISKKRLSAIREYIEEGGTFPTNIVVNIDKDAKLQFERGKQEGDGAGATFGWLTISPTYKCAWIIDGQHRLFSYSGIPQSNSDNLAVLAFENLEPSKQAEMFININGEQKSVKQSLLQELYAELHWDAADDEVRLRAVISKTIQGLDEDQQSPLHGRILRASDKKDDRKCISINSLFKPLERGFYLAKAPNGTPEFLALWATTNEKSLKRSMFVLNSWFGTIRSRSNGWWELGASAGGGLAMNDGVTGMLMILRSVLAWIETSGTRLSSLKDEDLWAKVQPYAEALGNYYGAMDVEQRARFRGLRGAQGHGTATRQAQLELQRAIPSFNPPGLEEYKKAEQSKTNEQAAPLILDIEKRIHDYVMAELKREFTEGEEWWFEGVPTAVRQKASSRRDEDKGKRKLENYLDLIDNKKIIQENWALFAAVFGNTDLGTSKEKQLSWLSRLNEMRQLVMHASSGRHLTDTEMAELRQLNEWVTKQLTIVAATNS